MEDSVPLDHNLSEPHKGEDAIEAPSCAFPEEIEPNSSSPVDETLDKSDFVSAFTSDPNCKEGDTTGLLCKDLHENEQIPYDTHILERNIVSSDEKHELNDNHICPDDKGDGPDGRMAISVIGKSGVLSFLDENGRSDCDEKMVDAIYEDKGWTSPSGLPSLNGSDNSENEDCAEYPLPESCYISFGNMFPNRMHIIIIPDYVIYGGTLYTESQVMFSVESIKIDCSDPFGLEDKLVAEWMHSDVNSLCCKWSASVDAALVKLCVRANGMIKTKKHQENVKIIFSVTEANWMETEQRIMSLSERYNKIWASYPRDDMMWDDDDVYYNIDFSGGYLSNIAPLFEEVIYPKGDPDAVSISKRDVELLQPEIFINDTIIDFYIKYLKNKIPLNKKQRFHFFNSFFFRKLADLDKERGSVSEGRSAFLRVRKWTRKVNIFEKDYIFIPVNFNLHWSLLVICHPGEAANMKDGDVKDFPKLPCVLHMDSLKGTHSGVKSIIQSYIWEEWKERHPESLENGSTNFSCLRFVPLELPQQDNLFDCGLFLLHFVELFLEEAPLELNPLKISRFGTFLTADWFQPSEASLKRSVIWNLIYKLIGVPDEQAMAPPCNNDRASQANAEHDDGFTSASPKQVPDGANFCEVVKYDVQTEVVLQEFRGEPTVPSPCNKGRLAAPENPEHVDGQGAIVELFEGHTASPKLVTDNDNFCEVVKCDAQPEVVLQEFLKQGAPIVPFPQHLEHANHDNALHPAFTPAYCVLMDDACTSEQLVLTNIGGEYNHSPDGQLNVELCATLLSHMEVAHERSANPMEESAEQNLLHDSSNLKDIDIREDESLVAADNSGFVTDFVVSIYQMKLNGHNKKFQENDETKSEEGDSGGCPRVHVDKDDEEDHHKSCQIAEPVDAVSEDKDVPMGDTVIQVGSTDRNNMMETISEYSKEGLGTKAISEEQDCPQIMSADEGKTRDCDGEKNTSQLASPDKFEENDEIKPEKGDSGDHPRVHADEEDNQISCKIARDSIGCSRGNADKEYEEDHHKSCQIAESVNAASEDKNIPMVDTVIPVGSADHNYMMQTMSEHCQEDCSTKAVAEEQDCQQISVYEGRTGDCHGQKNPSHIASTDKVIAGEASSHGVQMIIDTIHRQPNKKRKPHAVPTVPSTRRTRSRAKMLDPR